MGSNQTSLEPYPFMMDSFNLTKDEYLIFARGPKHLPPEIVIPITIMYVIIFITGVVGNLSVCIVIIKNKSLHTATNFYLFSLAISDLAFLLLGLPNDLAVYWQQYPWVLGQGLCKFRAIISEMTSYTSVLTIVAFSMERYLAICQPIHYYTMAGLNRATKIIAFVWIVSLIFAIPFAVFTTISYIDYPPGSKKVVIESAFCAMLENNIPKNFPIYELSALLFFVLPLIIITILYIKIGRTIQEGSSLNQVEGTIHGETHSQNRKSIIRMLTAVVIMFFICWAPFHAQRLLYIYGKNLPYYQVINEWLFYIGGLMYYVSSTMNPILYNLMSVKYRIAFYRTLLCFKRSTNGVLSRETEMLPAEGESFSRGHNRSTIRSDCRPNTLLIREPTPCYRNEPMLLSSVTSNTKVWKKNLKKLPKNINGQNRSTDNDHQSAVDPLCPNNTMETCI